MPYLLQTLIQIFDTQTLIQIGSNSCSNTALNLSGLIPVDVLHWSKNCITHYALVKLMFDQGYVKSIKHVHANSYNLPLY